LEKRPGVEGNKTILEIYRQLQRVKGNVEKRCIIYAKTSTLNEKRPILHEKRPMTETYYRQLNRDVGQCRQEAYTIKKEACNKGKETYSR